MFSNTIDLLMEEQEKGRGCDSVVEVLPDMQKALNSILTTARKGKFLE